MGNSAWESTVPLGSLFKALWGGLGTEGPGGSAPITRGKLGGVAATLPNPTPCHGCKEQATHRKGVLVGDSEEARGRPTSCVEGGRGQESGERKTSQPKALSSTVPAEDGALEWGRFWGRAVQAQHGEGSHQQQPTILQPGDTVPCPRDPWTSPSQPGSALIL